jgi:hypothetical protein
MMKNKMKNGLIINSKKAKCYYFNDQIHRLEGPAIEYPNGTKFWYFHGLRHRMDGPAIEKINGYKEYWILGIKIK